MCNFRISNWRLEIAHSVSILVFSASFAVSHIDQKPGDISEEPYMVGIMPDDSFANTQLSNITHLTWVITGKFQRRLLVSFYVFCNCRLKLKKVSPFFRVIVSSTIPKIGRLAYCVILVNSSLLITVKLKIKLRNVMVFSPLTLPRSTF